MNAEQTVRNHLDLCIRLRPLELSDAPFIVRLLNDPDFLRNVGDRKVRTLADARRYLVLGPMDSHARHGFGLDCMELIESGEAVGICGLSKRPALPVPDLGYALLPEYRKRGLVAAAVILALADARDRLGLDRVAAVVNLGNTPSVRVLERAGFVPAGKVQLIQGGPELQYFLLCLHTAPQGVSCTSSI